MKLIVGLGNPEKQYDNTRHNIGFAVLDAFAEKQDLIWKENKKFKAYVAELPNKDLLVKPTTYYNLVGESVRAVADFYKISPEETLVIHDDIALPFGTIRTRSGGSDAGNNGIKSVNAHFPGTRRIRIGTNAEENSHVDTSNFVLGRFSINEREKLGEIVEKSSDYIDDFLNDKFPLTTHR